MEPLTKLKLNINVANYEANQLLTKTENSILAEERSVDSEKKLEEPRTFFFAKRSILPRGSHLKLSGAGPSEIDLIPNKTIFCEFNIQEVLDFQDMKDK